MDKKIPCFICKKLTKVNDEKAIATLCKKHKTEENLKTLSETPMHQLLRILNEGTEAKLAKLENKVNTLKKEPKKNIVKNTGKTNEYGELL